MGLSPHNNEGTRVTQSIHENNCCYLSTGTPTYWPTDAQKVPDLLDLFTTNGMSTPYIDMQASLSSPPTIPQ